MKDPEEPLCGYCRAGVGVGGSEASQKNHVPWFTGLHKNEGCRDAGMPKMDQNGIFVEVKAPAISFIVDGKWLHYPR